MSSLPVPVAASLASDAFLLLGVPALVYGGVLLLGTGVIGRRLGRARAVSFGLPAIGGVLGLALLLAIFAGVGAALVDDGADASDDAFVGWGRIVLVAIYAAAVLAAALAGRALARRAGAVPARYAVAAAMAVFFFVWISAPFSSIVNACHVGDAILINATVTCR